MPYGFGKRVATSGDSVQTCIRYRMCNAVALHPAAAEQIDRFKAALKSAEEAVVQFRNVAFAHTNSSLVGISEELGHSFHDVLRSLQEEFPPKEAPSREERVLMVSRVLMTLEKKTMEVLSRHGVGEAHIKLLFDALGPILQDLVVMAGDIAEQHPLLLEVLLSIPTSMIPEAWPLRVLFSLLGFGSYAPIEGSVTAWVQRRFWARAINTRKPRARL